MNYVTIVVGNRKFFSGKVVIVGIPLESHCFIEHYRNEAFETACKSLDVDPAESSLLDWSFLGPEVSFVNTNPNDKWISVRDRLPECGKRVLVSVQGIDESLIGWYDEEYEWTVENKLSESRMMPVTHWMEKPTR